MDFSGVVGAVDGATVVAAVLAVGAIIMAPFVAMWGVRTLLNLIDAADFEHATGEDGSRLEQLMDDDGWSESKRRRFYEWEEKYYR